MTKNDRKAFWLGVKDGYSQPDGVSTSYNVDHLDDHESDVYDAQDRGINLGQFLRAGIRSEAWREGYSVPFVRKAVVTA